VKFAIRQPANFLYRSIASPREARVTPEELPDCLVYMREQPGMQNRSAPFEVLMLLADFPADDRLNLRHFRIPRERDDVMALLERLQRAGATGAIVHLPPGTSGLDECIDWVAWFSREIIPEFRD
jgi:hypothetical protein